ncbi:phage/plasmid primase, P4 family [Candidatus Liberibacter sp.]|uniref:phage/plasmid primase, P4 family n=1 Tax=Candidatus Liberibacter sp. TaxID=34022 RepID=UPI0015F5A97B|nr:phage/plasmid primase, P4 family [Candidatus Liberibacter sp.]MBA5724566.1 PriCT-2 domain-containing protein [Candidatus Liberibacter sp.]
MHDVYATFKEQAKVAIGNGWHLIPIKKGEKKALWSKWQKKPLSVDMIDSLPPCGFGVLCGVGDNPVYGFDVDIQKENISETITAEFQTRYRNTVTRVGQPPKILIPFTMKEAGIKKTKSYRSSIGHFEILGHGQYFVVYNIHPATGKEYIWSKAPHEINVKNLPCLDVETRKEIFEVSVNLLPAPEKKNTEQNDTNTWKFQGNRWYTNREIIAILKCLGSEFYDGHHDDWIPIIMAVHHETYGHGKEIARAWCKQSKTKYNADIFNAKWNSFDFEEIGNADKKRSTFASLLYDKKYKQCIPAGLTFDRFSDVHIASLFAILTKGMYIYNEGKGGWYKRENHLWLMFSTIGGSMQGQITDFLLALKKDSRDLEEGSTEKDCSRAKYAKLYARKKMGETSKSKSVLAMLEAKSENLFVEADKIGCNERYIGNTDGITDLVTGKKVDHKTIPKVIITRSTGTPCVEGKPSREFLDAMLVYFCGDVKLMNFFALAMGMALFGNNKDQRIFNLIGTGANGKGTVMNLINSAFGSQYTNAISAENLNSVQAGGTNSSLVASMGTRILQVNETNEGAEVNPAVLKALSGGDKIDMRDLYCQSQTSVASFTVVYLSNRQLYNRHPDSAWWRRLVVIPFNAQFERDPLFEDEFIKKYSLECKKWIQEGARQFIAERKPLDPPAVCQEALQETKRSTDDREEWYEDHVNINEEGIVSVKEANDHFLRYLRIKGKERKISNNYISYFLATQNLQKVGRAMINGVKSTQYKGIELLPLNEFDSIDNNIVNLDDRR